MRPEMNIFKKYVIIDCSKKTLIAHMVLGWIVLILHAMMRL